MVVAVALIGNVSGWGQERFHSRYSAVGGTSLPTDNLTVAFDIGDTGGVVIGDKDPHDRDTVDVAPNDTGPGNVPTFVVGE